MPPSPLPPPPEPHTSAALLAAIPAAPPGAPAPQLAPPQATQQPAAPTPVEAESTPRREATRPLGPDPAPEPSRQPISAHEAPPAESSATEPVVLPQKSPPPVAAILSTLLILCLCGGTALYFALKLAQSQKGNRNSPSSQNALPQSTAAEDSYVRVGWQKDAYQVLSSFIAGKSPGEKSGFILDAARVRGTMEDFYGGGVINDADTPAEAFSIYELKEEDRRRGLFMMVYDQPAQLDMKEFFSPIAPIEVQKGLQDPDLLLSTMARLGNFSMEPVRVQAFFKRVGGELKLDWEIFAQTKYRTLQTFVELPEVGLTQTFRVLIVEDVPGPNIAEPGTRTYRVADPANTSDSAHVEVKIDSELGRTLSILNWRGIKGAKPITRTATIELKWDGTEDKPVLNINRFLCWEFLGLGGSQSDPQAAKPDRP